MADQIKNLSNNVYADMNPQIDAGQVTWYGSDGTDWEIFLYDGATTRQLTNNNYVDWNPQIDAGQVTWIGYDGADPDIFLYDDSKIVQLTNNAYPDEYPQIDAGQVTWYGYDGTNYEIFLYDGATTRQLTDNANGKGGPQIDAGQVAWPGHDGNDYEIFLYDGATTRQLTNNAYHDYDPQIDAGQVTWVRSDGTDWEIFLYDGATTRQLTENNYLDEHPQIDAGQVTWVQYDGTDYKIMLYDGATIRQLPGDADPNSYPQIDDGSVTWPGYTESDFQVLLFDGATVNRVSNGSYDGRDPQINSGQITWFSDDENNSFEIFLHTGSVQPPSQPINNSPANGATGVSLTPTLESSAFSDPDVGDTHAASQWQITTTSGNYSSPVFDSGEDTINLESINTPPSALTCNSTYYWHVRHQDNHGAWSNWSGETSFTTTANTPTGSNVSVELIGYSVTVTFAQVTTAGCTTLNAVAGPIENWGPVPSGFRALGTDAGEITTTAIYSGPVTVDVIYSESMVTDENALTVFYWDGTEWVEQDNVVVDTVNNRISSQIPFLAPGFMAEREGPAPPIVTTNYPINVFATSAKLAGYLDSKGSASSVNVSFQWATEDYYTVHSNYSDETSPLWPMTSTGVFSFSLTGLSPDTTYHFRAKAVGDSTAYGDDVTFPTYGPGTDGDGVTDAMENTAPNYGDGNYDGTLDSLQADVASLPNAANGEYATIESPRGTSLTSVASVNVNSLPSQGRPNLVFSYGLFSFNITGVPPGSTVWVTLRFENAVPAGSQYWKYGPTPDNHTPHWYQITMNSNDGDNVIQIPLVDGGLGDDDLTANGVIVDQGGPGQPPQPSGPSGAAGVPVFPSVYVGIGAALGAGLLAYFVRRRLIRAN